MEKPLKNTNLPDLSRYVVAADFLYITVECDYYTFREISSSIAKEYNCASEDRKESRIVFSPSCQTTQSGSSAANDLNIIFSCLVDLTTFLRIRDEKDYEAIICKEILTEESNMLRVLGTFSSGDAEDDITESNSATMITTRSVSAMSEETWKLILFVGSAPINYVEDIPVLHEDCSRTNDVGINFRYAVLQQELKHFHSGQKRYRTPWTTQKVRSRISVRSALDMDGTVPAAVSYTHLTLPTILLV